VFTLGFPPRQPAFSGCRNHLKRIYQTRYAFARKPRASWQTELVQELSVELAVARDEGPVRAPGAVAHLNVVEREFVDLTGASDPNAFDRALARSNPLRTAKSDRPLAAARDRGVRRLVAQSFSG